MEWALAREVGGPFAWLLLMGAVVAGIASWVGKRAEQQLDLLARVNRQLTEQLEAALSDAAQARAETTVARAEAQRATEDAETARFELQQARAMLADQVLRADVAQKVARELEDQYGVQHRRASDGGGS